MRACRRAATTVAVLCGAHQYGLLFVNGAMSQARTLCGWAAVGTRRLVADVPDSLRYIVSTASVRPALRRILG